MLEHRSIDEQTSTNGDAPLEGLSFEETRLLKLLFPRFLESYSGDEACLEVWRVSLTTWKFSLILS